MNQQDMKLWLAARDDCKAQLGRFPTNEEMVDFAQSKNGHKIRHLFDFADVPGSARQHWISQAAHYTRCCVEYTQDPAGVRVKVRALHVINEGGKHVIATNDEVASKKSRVEDVLQQCSTSIFEFINKYEHLAIVFKSTKLHDAVKLMKQAKDALK